MIDIDAILAKFIQVAREPTYTPALRIVPEGGLKAVFKERPDDTPKPNYPYITLDVTSIEQENGWLMDSYVNDDDLVTYETNYDLLLTYRCYGKGARGIMNQLEGYFRFGRVLDDITTTTGGKVVQTLTVNSLPQRLADKYVDSASFDLIFAITDVAVDDQSGVINLVNIEGELDHYFDPDDPDPNPLPVSITVDYNNP